MSNLVPLFIDKDSGEFVASSQNVTGNNGPPGGGGDTSWYYHEQTSTSASWNIQHNNNNTKLVCQIFDSNNEQILPSSVTINNINTITVTFGTPITGTARIVFFN